MLQRSPTTVSQDIKKGRLMKLKRENENEMIQERQGNKTGNDATICVIVVVMDSHKTPLSLASRSLPFLLLTVASRRMNGNKGPATTNATYIHTCYTPRYALPCLTLLFLLSCTLLNLLAFRMDDLMLFYLFLTSHSHLFFTLTHLPASGPCEPY
ncbi:hypothetical protein IWZ03DRAFT_101933 [Phyllosticta citriasiana]|uniref:Uncharacterized protein n=1 Tax=Phyllosticta citriasiana TaxID=595635 RepID=A0ABR1KVF6_9PEZI